MSYPVILKNTHLQQTLLHNGLVKLPPVGLGAVQKLQTIFEELHPDLDESFFKRFHVGIHSNDFVYKKKLHEAISAVMDDYLGQNFIDYRRLVWTAQIKGTGENSLVPLHQDWSVVDERKYAAFTVWLPLCNSTVTNGAIHYIPGTHLFKTFPRGGTIRGKFDQLGNDVLDLMEPAECEAGSVLMFDNRVLHYSPPNITNVPRISIITLVVPKEAPCILFYKNPEEQKAPIEMIQMEDDFHLHFRDFLSKQGVVKPDGKILSETLEDIAYSPDRARFLKEFSRYKKLRALKRYLPFFKV